MQNKMTTARDIFQSTWEKIKRLERFEIIREVEKGWLPSGRVPFDVRIKKGIATFIVYAEFIQDAEDQVTKYLESMDDSDE
jgi:hypothetical protein